MYEPNVEKNEEEKNASDTKKRRNDKRMHIGIQNHGSLLIVAGVVLIRKHTIILAEDSSRCHFCGFVCWLSEKNARRSKRNACVWHKTGEKKT